MVDIDKWSKNIKKKKQKIKVYTLIIILVPGINLRRYISEIRSLTILKALKDEEPAYHVKPNST